MNLIEAAKELADAVASLVNHGDMSSVEKRLVALRKAIEQAEKQEPVFIKEPTYHDEAMGCGLEDQTRLKEVVEYDPNTGLMTWLAPTGNRAVNRILEQIPNEPLYTHPAKKWVGLTDDKIDALTMPLTKRKFARVIEATLKAKNGGQPRERK